MATSAPLPPSMISLTGSRRAQGSRWNKDQQLFFLFSSLQIPDVDINVDELMEACMSGSEVMIVLDCINQANLSNFLVFAAQACPTLEDAVNFVQSELGADLDDEAINGIYKCAPEILSQLGFARK